tara:strand:- start:447 stop:851 length:405 start_codon:yes stop_codon:yes gene_type:complete
MGWENILKKRFNFDSLKFEKKKNRSLFSDMGTEDGPWRTYYKFGNIGEDDDGYPIKVGMSIIAGQGTWSEPQFEMLDNPLDYRTYEVMLPKKETIDLGIDDVEHAESGILGYQTKEQITKYARMIEEAVRNYGG